MAKIHYVPVGALRPRTTFSVSNNVAWAGLAMFAIVMTGNLLAHKI
jgi:hypothetical protein